MRRVLPALVALVAEAHAGPTTVTAEGGAEADTNIERIDSTPGNERIAGPVGRLGAKLDHRGRLAGGGYAMQVSGIARVVTTPEAADESTALTIADLRWLRPVGERQVSAGFAVSGADASPLAGGVGSRTFRSLGADALLVMRGGEGKIFLLGFGGRAFTYKPDRDFDWRGPSATARLDLSLWEAAAGTRSLELAAYAGFEARAYDSTAAANACPEDAMPEDPRVCPAGTSLPRRDRYHRLGIELTWIGAVVAAAGYQLSVTDSNSFGQSLVRHRFLLSATRELPGRIYGTFLATLQFDQYLDGLIVQEDLQNQTFTTLDDENRSSLQLRLARPLTKTWSLESRTAIWRDLDGNSESTFRRAIVYLGAMYSR
jgi:hypothetical protein